MDVGVKLQARSLENPAGILALTSQPRLDINSSFVRDLPTDSPSSFSLLSESPDESFSASQYCRLLLIPNDSKMYS